MYLVLCPTMAIRRITCAIGRIPQTISLRRLISLSRPFTHFGPYCKFIVGTCDAHDFCPISPIAFPMRSHTCGELNHKHVGADVSLCGWIYRVRMSRFVLLWDAFGITQVNLSLATSGSRTTDSTLKPGSVVHVTGTVIERPAKDVNKNMMTGEIEIAPKRITVLNTPTVQLPFTDSLTTEVNEQVRLKFRFLDLRSEILQRNLRFRSSFILRMRQFLSEAYGNTYIMVLCHEQVLWRLRHLICLEEPLGLPQSPQQFKQLLMVGGIDRYMQIARCFRDEASRADRQPEFTQLDLEMSFVSMEDVFQVIQNTLSACWDLIRRVKSDESADHPSFDRMKYQTCMSRFGTDKPDIRFEFSFCEPTKSDLIGFSVPASHAVFLSHSDWKKIRRSVKDASGSDIISFKTAFAPSDFNELVDALQANPDDYVVFVRGSSNSQKKSLGLARTEVAKVLHEKGDSIYKPGLHFLWVSDFPLFELDETGQFG
ncbi:Aspartate--tRNA ligase [Fasciola gigantica]|uniref:Aspartate--tRNA ligase n=1 Tax=Fasciola gigantica TaxID=46835 RepID=A0A504YM59_FASGI|nr:Aspartate--tRNA ligase [Fasciola gigantica]